MTRDEYVQTYGKYYKLDTTNLTKVIGDLWKRREMGDISIHNEHRIAARVLIERERTGETLVFHMKNFIK
jgi:hypothetical protein